jgi:hypothetical protein
MKHVLYFFSEIGNELRTFYRYELGLRITSPIQFGDVKQKGTGEAPPVPFEFGAAEEQD